MERERRIGKNGAPGRAGPCRGSSRAERRRRRLCRLRFRSRRFRSRRRRRRRLCSLRLLPPPISLFAHPPSLSSRPEGARLLSSLSLRGASNSGQEALLLEALLIRRRCLFFHFLLFPRYESSGTSPSKAQAWPDARVPSFVSHKLLHRVRYGAAVADGVDKETAGARRRSLIIFLSTCRFGVCRRRGRGGSSRGRARQSRGAAPPARGGLFPRRGLWSPGPLRRLLPGRRGRGKG